MVLICEDMERFTFGFGCNLSQYISYYKHEIRKTDNYKTSNNTVPPGKLVYLRIICSTSSSRGK